MIVLKVYVAGIAIRKTKCNSPVLIYLQSPCTGAGSFEFVQPKVRQGDIFYSTCCIEHVKSIIIVVVILGIAAYVVYRFLRKPMVTGAPEEMPPIVEPIVEQVTDKLEKVGTKIMHPRGGGCRPGEKTMIMDAGRNGQPPPEAPKDATFSRGSESRAAPSPPEKPSSHGSQ